MSLMVYNTLGREKQEFQPLEEGRVKMYVCGPTVYDYCHLGHGRAYVAFDVIYRYLKYKGFKVRYARNITDIDDKIIARAGEMPPGNKSLGEKVTELAESFTREFHKDMDLLRVQKPTDEPGAIEYIPRMIVFIGKLIANKKAYKVEGDIYYDVAQDKKYGILSGRTTDELLVGARVEPDRKKKSPLDFALWKASKPGEPSWDSPWGPGRPGWHIECSAMALDIMGGQFDIHGGGQDLIFPHHENEIAQSYGITGKIPARYWIHNGFVNINREKMSKSLGNFFTLRDIFGRYDPMTVRLFLLSQHYRSPVDFSDQLLEDAGNALERIQDCIFRTEMYLRNKKNTVSDKIIYFSIRRQFEQVMDDDFNTARALGIVFDIVRDLNKDLIAGSEGKKIRARLDALNGFLTDVLGITAKSSNEIIVHKSQEEALSEAGLDKLLGTPACREQKIALIRARNYYRKSKQWALADKVRRYLADKGYLLRDTSSETIATLKI